MERTKMIPKTIHYCWFGGGRMQPLHRECLDSWQRLLPGYRLRRWDESNAPLDAAPFVRDAFRQRRWAFVADYVRIAVLLEHGGIYMDTDMLLLKSLDDFLHHRAFAGFEDERNVNFALVGAESGHPFLKRCRDRYDNMSFDARNPPLIPHVVSDLLRSSGMKNAAVQEICGLTLYPPEYFYPWPFEVRSEKPDFREFSQPESRAVHLWNHSWKPKDGVVRRLLRALVPRRAVDFLHSLKNRSTKRIP